MKFIAAMDSFKGSLSSLEANEAVRKGIKTIFEDADIRTFPMADGGEGTIDALIDGLGGEIRSRGVNGPLGDQVNARYGFVDKENLAVIEIAEACGLTLLSRVRLDPGKATTYGIGELISHAYDDGARTFIIGLGGSATNDGGVGMLQAMGYDFLDQAGNPVGFGGAALSNIHKVIKTEAAFKFDDCNFSVACDVNNPLYGSNGATYVFGPQKGVTEESLPDLDDAMKHYAEVTEAQMGIDIASVEGGGAAGGLGAAFYGYLDARLEPGIRLVIGLLDLESEIKDADLVITGEGRLDAQTAMGKVPSGIAKTAEKHEVPVIAFGGSVTDSAYELTADEMSAIFSIQHTPMSLEEAMDSGLTRFNLEKTVSQVISVLAMNHTKKFPGN
ncbi:glycerate kinase family protein [Lacicoccus alkaliphilus]|uniref:Glycerate kinase n=1 Tax=Lacicoccus alkaliphilus DSM 16010 TaxID=1123231 RepID=A0A1M7A5I8_9BACL|nr:glycerate kinase [Salinicoccus alkaliphilus]SHL37987.1 glycerate kinase [Salinicoccus alkaliphilus DSM 16010]